MKVFTCRLFSGASWVYLVLLFAWLAARLATGDRYGYLGMVNLLAVYLFFPLPLVLLVAILGRARGLGVAFAIGLGAFLWFWGSLFLPSRWPGQHRAQAGDSTLTVMTYNVLAWHRHIGPILDTIRAEDPDVVFIQELNHDLAQVLQSELSTVYPFQVHEPANNPTGIGVISKFPINPTGERLPHRWIGGPIILEMEWNGQSVTLVNFHMYSTTGLASQEIISGDFRIREEQAQLLADLARRSGPAILGGDANSAPLNDAYRILTAELHDAWQEAGFGLGHTFPGSTVPGSDRPRIGRWYVPRWLARIDYIFHSQDWDTVSARTAKIDDVSDHRGVLAVLRLK